MRIDPLTPIAFNETQNTRTALLIQSLLPIEVGRERDYLSWTRALVTGGLQTCNPRFQSSEFLFHLQLFKALGVRKPRALPKDEDDLQITANTKLHQKR